MSDKSASDNCGLYEVSFKIQVGNLPKQSHSSSENIFKTSKRKGYFGAVLSKIVRQLGFSLVQDSSRFLDRVCNPCGRKIRKLDQLYYFVKNATTTTSTPVKTSKRNLDTPDKASPPWRKSKSVRIVPPLAILLWGKFLLPCDWKSFSHLKTQWIPRLPCWYRKMRCLVIWMWKIFQTMV